jgi:hypothetical protein
MGLKKVEYKSVGWIQLAEVKVQPRVLIYTVKRKGFLTS